MDERRWCDWGLFLKSVIALCTTALLLSGCVRTCEPYIGSNGSHHLDWVPDHYEGTCFVPGHNVCYRGTSSCIGPYIQGYWNDCGCWQSAYYPCWGPWQHYDRCMDINKCCRSPCSVSLCDHVWPRWVPWNWPMWHRPYPMHSVPHHYYWHRPILHRPVVHRGVWHRPVVHRTAWHKPVWHMPQWHKPLWLSSSKRTTH